MMRRESPEEPPSTVFTDQEIEFLDQLMATANPDKARNLNTYMIKVACLGGHL